MKKKILITLPSFQDPGGVAAFYNSLLPYFPNEEYVFPTLEIGSTRGSGNLLYPVFDQLRFSRALASYGPDLVLINPSLDLKSFLRDGLLTYQAKRKRLPVLLFFHGWCKDFEEDITRKFLWFFKHTFGQADSFVVLATEFKNVLQQWGVTQPIYLGTTTIDESLLSSFSISNKLTQINKAPQIKILFLARLHREKGVFETVDAVSMLIQKGLSVSLSIAGDGPIVNELQKYVKSLNIQERSICFLGYVRNTDKINTFAGHHLYCLPSYSEGLPTSVLEAMAFGLPVITRPVGGLVDIFEEGKMGFMCKGKTAVEIADALEKIITNRPLMLQMSEYNHTFAKEHFMASVVAKKLSGIYKATIVSDNK